MTGLEKWRKEQHKDIDNTFSDEAYEKIMNRELNICRWCIYCNENCEKSCKVGIKAYLDMEVE